MYGVDVHDQALMRARPWTWLRDLILGLLTKPAAYDLAGAPHYATRIQSALWVPPADSERGSGRA